MAINEWGIFSHVPRNKVYTIFMSMIFTAFILDTTDATKLSNFFYCSTFFVFTGSVKNSS